MIEREIKLALPGRFVIPPLVLDGNSLTRESLPELDLRATYFDTADLRLARHGATMRYRTGESGGPRWTLKLPLATTAGTTLTRDELHFDAPRREPPPEAQALVTALVRREPLVAVATLRTRRRRSSVLLDQEEVAELADDEVSVVEGRRIVSRFRELEIEAKSDDAPIEALAEQLRHAGATDAEPIPKVVRALGSRATAPADVSIPSVPSTPTLADALAVSISDALLRLIRNDPPARLGDAEALHQMRVSLRRLRSDLTTLTDIIDTAWSDRVEPALRGVTDALGEARDLDVLVERLASQPGVEGRLDSLLSILEARRSTARQAMSRALTDPTYPALLDELVAAAAEPPVVERASAPASTLLPTLVMRAWDRLQRRADRLAPTSDDDDFHRARIAAKRARYAAELAARVLEGSQAAGAAGLAKRLADLQDQLGGLQDAAVAEVEVRKTLAGSAVDTGYAFEAGRLVEQQRARAADARRGSLEAWKGVRRRRWRKWAAV